MSLVANVKVNNSVIDAVGKVMNLAKWKNYIKKDGIILKVNAVWDKVYPSCTTTPMVIEGVIKKLKNNGFKDITIVDTNTPAFMNADKSFKILGIKQLADKYNVKTKDLTYDKFKTINFNGLVLKKLKISNTLLKAKTIITMPILKTHGITKITGAIKNQWGCIHDLRHQYHKVVNKALADVNNFFKNKIKFAVMDALFGMEGNGPKSGDPVIVGHVLASHDLVSLDSVAATIIGLDPKKIESIVFTHKEGIGERKFSLVGDKLPHFKFKKPGQNLAIKTEMILRHTPFEDFFFNTKFFQLFRVATKIYYDLWYQFKGKKYAKEMMKSKFGKIWQTYLKK